MLYTLLILCILPILPLISIKPIEDEIDGWLGILVFRAQNFSEICEYDVLPEEFYTNNFLARNTIINYHNFFRMYVNPPASNMLYMHWSPEAASFSEGRASGCKARMYLKPSVQFFNSCGQTVYTSFRKVSWDVVIANWFSQREYFKHGNFLIDDNNLPYVQMVRAATHLVGCAAAECKTHDIPPRTYYTYVCTYCPKGRTLRRPYKKGLPCSSCSMEEQDCYESRLCMNSCQYVDEVDNCEHLSKFKDFCSKPYLSRRCNATCICGKNGQIFEPGYE